MSDWLNEVLRDRPWWMNLMMVFCAYMTFVYMPWDIFIKPVAEDAEVWFGYLFTGASAKWAALPHWFVYAAGLYGFRRMRPWMGVAGSLYLAQVTLAMLIWPILNQGVGVLFGILLGAVAAVPFGLLTMTFWNERHVFQPLRDSLRDRYGDWALITGASAGLGAEFARVMASEGVNCVLTARREDRLTELADRLTRQFGIETRTIALDLAAPGAPNELADAVADLPIAILINNAGFGYAGRFDRQDPGRLTDMIALNCTAPVLLTSRLLPPMRERGCGAVIITGSISGRQPLALHGVYSATKAFDLHFGEALALEMSEFGVDVLVLEPGATQTEFGDAAGQLEHHGADPVKVVHAAFEALGRQSSVIAGWFNWIRTNAATRFASRPMVAHVARWIMSRQTPPEMR